MTVWGVANRARGRGQTFPCTEQTGVCRWLSEKEETTGSHLLHQVPLGREGRQVLLSHSDFPCSLGHYQVPFGN